MSEEYKYLLDGQAVTVVRELGGGFLVSRVYEAEEGDYVDPQIFFVEQVFDSAPTEKLDARLADIERRIAEKRKDLAKLDAEEKASRDRLATLSKLPDFSRVLDFIDGKITHYVELGCLPDITEFNAAMKTDNTRDLKLLTLFGSADGKIYYGLNQYRDGSGISTTVIPCQSREEAVKMLAEHVVGRLRDQMERDLDAPSFRLAEIARSFGIELPTEIRRFLAEKTARQLHRALAQKKKEKASIERELAKLEEAPCPKS